VTRERLAVAAGTALFLYFVFFRAGTFVFPFPAGSNGVFFDEAWRILHGEVMYRDFFEFVGPGTAHLNALVLWLFGSRIAALGYLAIAIGAWIALVLHELAAQVSPWPWRLLAPASFAALAYAPYTFGDHKWPALAAGLSGIAVLTRAAGPAGAIGAGLLLGTSALFTQDIGLGLGVGAFAFLIWRGERARAGLLAVAASLPPLAALLAFAWKAGLGTMLYDWVSFPMTRYRELNPFRITAAPSPRTLPRDLAQVCLALLGLLGALAALRPGGGATPTARLVALSGLGAFVATSHRGLYPMLLAVQSSVLTPLAVGLLADRLRGASLAGRPLSWAALGAIGVGVLHGSIGFVAWRQLLQPLAREQRRAGAIWTAHPMPELDWIESSTEPDDAVFLLPARGGHYFLTHTRDVTTFPYMIEGQSTEAQARAALAQIAAARPRVGLWDQRPWPRSAPEAPGPLSLLFDGLRERYDAERLPSGVFLLRRREAWTAAEGGPGPPRGTPLPELRALDQDGNPRSLASLRGRNGLLVNFNRSVVW
jgi:hypothetical protein